MSAVGNGAGQITDRDLRLCTVRIDIAGTPKGTGFFVAPGHVVTCEHVLEGATAGIQVSDLAGTEYSVLKVADVSKDADLAVLQVTPSAGHPCVLLIGGQNFDDRFITFGYPELHREGVASPLVAEGNTGDERLLKLGQGQVQPGMSGAPILNTRTGGVCAVLSWTRNEQLDLGGYAIPIERLWLLSPILKRQNEAYHEANRPAWVDRLPTIQKKVLLDARPGTPSTAGFTTWFVISVGGEQRHWRVSATLYPSGELLPDEPAAVHLVLDQVARLFRDWAARAHIDPTGAIRRRFNQGEEIRLLGSILFDAVLPDEIGKRFDELLAAADERVQLALHFDRTVIPTEFVDMPWEYLYLGADRGFQRDAQLAAEEKLAFVRVARSEFREPERPSVRRLSALFVPVTPPSEGGESFADNIAEHASSVIDAVGGVDAKRLPMAKALDLKDEVASGAYDIVHYVGFGRYYEGSDRLALGGFPYDYREAQMFAALLPDGQQGPRVVVLQQIDGPSDFVPPDLSVFAWRLLERGVEAVVAYQFPLAARFSKEFNKVFYTQLAAGETLETAVQNARASIWTMEPDAHAFRAPAGFVTRPGELRLTAAAGPSAPSARVGFTAAHA